MSIEALSANAVGVHRPQFDFGVIDNVLRDVQLLFRRKKQSHKKKNRPQWTKNAVTSKGKRHPKARFQKPGTDAPKEHKPRHEY